MLPSFSYSRTLVVDASTAQGQQLAEQLNRAGFSTEFVVSWHAARAALRSHNYQACVAVADPGQVEDLKQLTALRRTALGVWIIALCDRPTERMMLLARRQGVDAVLCAPFSMLDLTSRLAVFSHRSRPTF